MNGVIDLKYIQMAQKAFEDKVGDREEFRKLFGKSWL